MQWGPLYPVGHLHPNSVVHIFICRQWDWCIEHIPVQSAPNLFGPHPEKYNIWFCNVVLFIYLRIYIRSIVNLKCMNILMKFFKWFTMFAVFAFEAGRTRTTISARNSSVKALRRHWIRYFVISIIWKF